VTDCLFCKIIAGEIPSTAVYSDDTTYAFRDINPQAPVHVLVVPRRHIARISDASPDDEVMLGQLLFVAAEIARQEGISDAGYRLVVNCGENGQQAVDHLHVHVVGGRLMTWPPG
jgi:histidine triad (HIT) family protein